MDAQIAVGSIQQPLQLLKGKRLSNSKSADDPKAHALMNDGIELGRGCLFMRRDRPRCGADILVNSRFGLQLRLTQPH